MSDSTISQRELLDFLRTREGSVILRQAVHEAIGEAGLSERMPEPSAEAAELIRLLADRSGESRDNVLLKALRLYDLALDAIEKGNYLAILTPEDEIVREIIGFEPVGAAGRPVVR